MALALEIEEDLDLECVEMDYEDDATATLEYEDFEAMGINPTKPTPARPGTEEKVLMLSARYAAGMPLWHQSDCYDHGPRESELMGSAGGVARLVPQVQLDTEE